MSEEALRFRYVRRPVSWRAYGVFVDDKDDGYLGEVEALSNGKWQA